MYLHAFGSMHVHTISALLKTLNKGRMSEFAWGTSGQFHGVT